MEALVSLYSLPALGETEIGRYLVLDDIRLLPFSVSIEHGDMQHAETKYLRHISVTYHLYVSPDDVTLRYSVVISYNWGISITTPRKGNRAYESTNVGKEEEATVHVDTARD